MALHLSQSDDRSTPATSDVTAPVDSPWLTLVKRGRAALTEGDLAGWTGAFADAADLDGLENPYRVRKHLLESGLAYAQTCPAPTVPNVYLAIARAALDALEAEAREPYILNYAGVALYELGSLVAAENLFKGARKLDQETPHVSQNLAAVRDRRKRGRGSLPLPQAVSAVLPDLARRSERVLERARPVEGLTMSLCMIVKDEEEMLPQCLEAVASAVDEIVIVDTGSTDRTVEIAESFGAKVVHFEWTGSFGEARNVSLEHATCDWMLLLDADEVVVAQDTDRLRELTGHVWREAFYMVETNHTGDLDDGTSVTHNTLRVFRNRPHYRFEGLIHEQIAHLLPSDLPERLEMTDVRIEHYGYLGAVRDAKSKSQRNIELLQQQVAEGDDSPFLAFNLGSEYAAAGDARRALDEFRRSWEGVRHLEDFATRGFVPSLVGRFVKALRFEGLLDEADQQARQGLRSFPGFTDLVFEQACVAQQRGDRARAVELFERCIEWGDAPSAYSPTVGAGTYLAMLMLAALEPPERAREMLARCLDEHPSFLGAVLPLANAMLDTGATGAEVATQIESKVEVVTPSVRFMIGTAQYERGFAPEAEIQFRAVAERQPDNPWVSLALAESLLATKQFREATEIAAAVDDSTPAAAIASRAQAFGALALGDAEGARAALVRAERVGLGVADLEVLAGWLALTEGNDPPEALSVESAASLAEILEALLRVEEVDAFAELVGLVDRLELTWRERRELLAAMYLRRGFLDSAADEWISVCQQEMDVPALVGLTQVALAKGLPDDARSFAEEAVAIAPMDPAARAAANAVGI